jgi:hypothetical protein
MTDIVNGFEDDEIELLNDILPGALASAALPDAGPDADDSSANASSLSSYVGEKVDSNTGVAPIYYNSNPFTGDANFEPSTPTGQTFELSFAVTPNVNESSSNAAGSTNAGGPEGIYWNGALYNWDGTNWVEVPGPVPPEFQPQSAPPPQPQSSPPPPAAPLPQLPAPTIEPLTTTPDRQLNLAIQEAAGPYYDPNLYTTAQLGNINDVLSGSDWGAFLGGLEANINPGNLPPGPNPPTSLPQMAYDPAQPVWQVRDLGPDPNSAPNMMTTIPRTVGGVGASLMERARDGDLPERGPLAGHPAGSELPVLPRTALGILAALPPVTDPKLWAEIARTLLQLIKIYGGEPDSSYNPETPPAEEYPVDMPELPDPLAPPPMEPPQAIAEPDPWDALRPSENLGLSEDEANLWEETLWDQDFLDKAFAGFADLLGDFFPPVLTDSSGNLVGWPPRPGGA